MLIQNNKGKVKNGKSQFKKETAKVMKKVKI